MNKVARDFVSEEPREFKVKLGRTVASALTGFVAGVLVASIIFYTIVAVLD